MLELTRNLTEAYGPSGFEDDIRAQIRDLIAPHVDELRVDAMGNLIARKHGDGSGVRVMVAAHMDEIGLMVSHITEHGFLRFTNIGGVHTINLNGTRVRFADGRIGVIHSEKRDDAGKLHAIDKHYIDIGATSRADCPVRVGEAAIFWQPFVVQNDRWTAKSIDDRIGCAIAIDTLQKLTATPHDVYFVFTVQEEVGVRGATTAANGIAADVGIALDVTLSGDTPNGPSIAVELGKGPAIKVKDSGMIAHPGLVRLMAQRAEEADIPHQYEVLVGGSTDARAIQLAGLGAAAGCISIPCRYVHTTSETIARTDAENAVQLLLTILSHPIVL